MLIDTEKLRTFFKKTGKVQEVSWDANVLRIKKTVQPDERLSFNDTFLNIHKQLKKCQTE